MLIKYNEGNIGLQPTRNTVAILTYMCANGRCVRKQVSPYMLIRVYAAFSREWFVCLPKPLFAILEGRQ